MELAYLVFFVIAVVFFTIISLKKLIRIVEAENKIDWGHRWLNRLDGMNRLFCHRYHRQSREYVAMPDKGPAIVVANHMSGLDPFLLIAASRRPLRFLVAQEEYQRFGFTWLFKAAGCIPVDRSKNPERALHEALVALNHGEVVALFPHGGIRWPTNLEVKIKGGAVRLAQRKQCAIYPVYITGVGLKGFTVPALIVRSRISLKFYDPLLCDPVSYDKCMDTLAQILNQSEDHKVT